MGIARSFLTVLIIFLETKLNLLFFTIIIIHAISNSSALQHYISHYLCKSL